MLPTKSFLTTFCLGSLLLTSCSKDTFPKYSSLDRLRILAIVANTPELQNPAAGITNIQITPYISDIGGTGDVQLTLQSCLDPGVALGATPDCNDSATASSIQSITMSSASTITEGLFGDPERTGAPQSGAITVPLQIPVNLLDQFSQTLQYNGISYLITITATTSNNIVKSFRRILVSNKAPNSNPTLSDLLIDQTSLTQTPSSGTHTLTFSTADTPESYQFLKGNGDYRSLQESYEITWFASEGTLNTYRATATEPVTWKTTTPNPTPAHKPVVVGVLRDGRGGLSVKVKTLSP
jgi:hypothetical protein